MPWSRRSQHFHGGFHCQSFLALAVVLAQSEDRSVLSYFCSVGKLRYGRSNVYSRSQQKENVFLERSASSLGPNNSKQQPTWIVVSWTSLGLIPQIFPPFGYSIVLRLFFVLREIRHIEG